MISKVLNNIYESSCDFAYRSVQISKQIVIRVIKFVSDIFAHIGRFVLGFCVGAIVSAAYIYTHIPPFAQANDKAILLHCIVAGILLGTANMMMNV